MKKNWKETMFIVTIALVAYIAGAVEVNYRESKDKIAVTDIVFEYAEKEYGDIDYSEWTKIEKKENTHSSTDDWYVSYNAKLADGGDKWISGTSSLRYMKSETGNMDKIVIYR